MLESLSIRNVVLIDKLDLEFTDGLTILSGETGAGKSILLDSLGLVLGQRADTSLIRQGEDKLSVTAVFSLPPQDSNLFVIANDNDIDISDMIVIKRSLTSDGKSKIFINDQPVSLKLLKEFGNELVEVHGQFDNHGLLNQSNHRKILDNYGQYKDLCEDVAKSFVMYKQAVSERISAEGRLRNSKLEEDNLRHWINELKKLNPMVGEEEELNQRRTEIINSEKLVANLNYAYGSLTQSNDVISAIRHAQAAIDKADGIVGGKYREISDTLEQTLVNAEEAVRLIEDISSSLNYNQDEADMVEQRLYALRGAARKHQVSIDELPQKLKDMEQQISAIELGEDGLIEMVKKEDKLRLIYLEKARKLSDIRQKTAKMLDKSVMNELISLKMEKASFVTLIENLDESKWGTTGIDDVSFTVSTNPNSPQGPLNKIASGGELARFMLALKVNLAASSDNMTMIFDEVDSGVGGATAKAVGERLARLAKNVQILVVTHSPQVAACGNNHFKVEKNTLNNITTTNVYQLSQKEKEEEIARMLAGEQITDEARAAAKVLMDS